MLKISLGTKPAFFFCGSIAMSRKTNSYLSLDVSKLTDKEVQGLLRAQKTGAIVINEGLDLLEATVKSDKEVIVEQPVVEVTKVEEAVPEKEEIKDGQETNEDGFQEITQEVLNDSSEELEVDKQVPVKQTRNTRKKS